MGNDLLKSALKNYYLMRYVIRYLGPRIASLRLKAYADRYLGRSRRVFAPRPWDTIRLDEICRDGVPGESISYAGYRGQNTAPFLFPPGRTPTIPEYVRDADGRRPTLSERADLLNEMRCVYFCEQPSPERIDWHHDPFHGGRSAPGPTWCDIPCYLPEQGDPRMLWEPARCAWALDIARVAARRRGEETQELLWRWIDDWMEHCPPFRGFQWWCGQEASIRFASLAISILACSEELSPERWVSFARLAWATGFRVYHHINYAISQKNNHALSEATGLMMIGHLFPELRDSRKWWDKGRKVMQDELIRQCYKDGTYLQQSHNYHRVMLQNAILAVRIAELADEPFGKDVYDIIDRSTAFLFQMSDPLTGHVPQYGNNDGAHVLPLSECDFHDFRPVIQAGHYLLHKERLLPPGPWDEDAIWLTGDSICDAPLTKERTPVSARYDDGGYYTLRSRGKESWMMTRCHEYRDRQSHRDALHLDLWWRGVNVLRDTGTYQYYVPGRPDIEDYFSSMSAHNVVQVDGKDALTRISRFMIYPWGLARVRHFEAADGRSYFEGESLDYDQGANGVLHRRAIIPVADGIWVVVDDLLGKGTRSARWWWHLADGELDVDPGAGSANLKIAEGCVGIAVRSASPMAQMTEIQACDAKGEFQGYAAPSYGRLDEQSVLQVDYSASLPFRVVTAFSLGCACDIAGPESVGESETWSIRRGDRSDDIAMGLPGRDSPRIVIT